MNNLPENKKKFTVPDNYFETLPDRTWQHINAQPQVAPRTQPAIIRQLWPLAAAAAVVVFFILFVFAPRQTGLNEIPQVQVLHYLEDNIDDLGLQQMIEAGEIDLPVENIATSNFDSSSPKNN